MTIVNLTSLPVLIFAMIITKGTSNGFNPLNASILLMVDVKKDQPMGLGNRVTFHTEVRDFEHLTGLSVETIRLS
jgi:hypothetical protein